LEDQVDAFGAQPVGDARPRLLTQPGRMRQRFVGHQHNLDAPPGQAGGRLAANEAGADDHHPAAGRRETA
jgi:hypothetical protein